jgi:hypothetical protein
MIKILNYCPNCGTKIDGEWNACPYCGHNIQAEKSTQAIPSSQEPIPSVIQQAPPQQQTPPPTVMYAPRPSNNMGIAALILGLLGLFIVPIVGSIVAIILGSIGKKNDDDPTMANWGLILGVIGLLCWGILLVMLFSWISWLFSSTPPYPY